MAEGRTNALYQSYSTTHAGTDVAAVESRLFRRDVRPHLSKEAKASQQIYDLGCGQGTLVHLLHSDGYEAARGVDLSVEQVAIARESGVTGIEQGDYRAVLKEKVGSLDALIGVDFVEHLEKDAVWELFNLVYEYLRPGGRLIIRSPNGASPFSGIYFHGDFTHETILTAHSFRQLCNSSGLRLVDVFPCPPPVHSFRSAVRATGWAAASVALKGIIAAEAGSVGNIVTQNFVGVAERP